MGGCSAPKCSGRPGKGVKMYRFPSDPERRRKWDVNCRRDRWHSNKNSRLCEVHFEESQFEMLRADGRRKLKQDAVPTIFNFVNCPKPISKRRILKRSISSVGAECHLDHNYSKRRVDFEEDECQEPNGEDIAIPVDEVEPTCEKCSELSLENRRLKAKVKQLEAKIEAMEKNLEICFNSDQMSFLKLPNRSRANHWSNETIMTALKIRCATGVQGYNFLRKLHYPLPAYRTLCNRIVSLDMHPGIQTMVLDWMAVKTAHDSGNNFCCLLMDEVQIAQAIEYDPALKRFIGFISSDFNNQQCEGSVASHVLVFMVKGVTTKWKQVIAYFFTGTAIDGAQLWGTTRKLICELGMRGFNVTAVVNDMGAANQAMWRAAGIVSTRSSVKCKVQHPHFSEQDLHFFADVPHLLKNLRSAFLKQEIFLPQTTVSKYGLPTCKVDSAHVKSLVKVQEERELKLAPKLTAKHVSPSTYEKMRVNMASQVLSHSTASAIRTLALNNELPAESLSTAFFCEYVNSWFDIMNCRCPKDGLFRNSNQKTSMLKESLELVQQIKIGNGSWKPVQAGMQMSISSLLSLHEGLVVAGDLAFLMSGRFTQDALENLFSQIRGFGNPHPRPTKFRVALRLITLAQFMDVPSGTSYDEDDSPHLLTFIKDHNERCGILLGPGEERVGNRDDGRPEKKAVYME